MFLRAFSYGNACEIINALCTTVLRTSKFNSRIVTHTLFRSTSSLMLMKYGKRVCCMIQYSVTLLRDSLALRSTCMRLSRSQF